MLRRPHIAFLTSALMCFVCVTCYRPAPSDSLNEISAEAPELAGKSKEIVRKVSEMNQSPWGVSARQVDGREALTAIHQLDERRWWVGGERALYESADAGQSWQRADLDVPPGAKVADIFFTASHGWVGLQTVAEIKDFEDSHFELLRSDDGGKSWRPQHVYKGAILTRIHFVSDQEGWLVGVKYVGPRVLDQAPLVLYTTDQGKHWADVSEELNGIGISDTGSDLGMIVNIVSEGPQTATVLTADGELFRTESGGQSWTPVVNKSREFSYMDLCCVGLKEDKLRWMAAGQLSTEGVGSLLFAEQPDGSWQSYPLPGVSMRDILFLPDKQIFIVGSIPPEVSRNDDLHDTDALVLYSSDGGSNWSVIYRTTHHKSVNAIAPVNSNYVRAVGDDGLILDISLSLAD